MGWREPWRAVPLSIINNNDLPTTAKFLYIWLITRPSDWDYSISGTAKGTGMNYRTVEKHLGTLKDAGYLKITQDRDENGQFTGHWEFTGPQETTTVPQKTAYGKVQTRIEESTIQTPSISPPSRNSTLPADWEPTVKHRQRAEDLGVSVDLEAEKFRNYWVANGGRKKDWDRTFTNWILQAHQWKMERVPQGAPVAKQGYRSAPND